MPAGHCRNRSLNLHRLSHLHLQRPRLPTPSHMTTSIHPASTTSDSKPAGCTPRLPPPVLPWPAPPPLRRLPHHRRPRPRQSLPTPPTPPPHRPQILLTAASTPPPSPPPLHLPRSPPTPPHPPRRPSTSVQHLASPLRLPRCSRPCPKRILPCHTVLHIIPTRPRCCRFRTRRRSE